MRDMEAGKSVQGRVLIPEDWGTVWGFSLRSGSEPASLLSTDSKGVLGSVGKTQTPTRMDTD